MVWSWASSASIRALSARPAGEPVQQRPAQVGVDLEALERLGVLQQALELVERLVGVRGGGERPDEGQLVVTARLRVREQLAQPLLPGRLERRPVGRRGEVVDRLGAVAGDPAHAERVGLGADVGQHQVDEVGGAHLRVAGHVPRRTPAQRLGQRVVEPGQAADDGGERPLVEADLGVGQVAVVEQQQVRLLLADQVGDLGARAVDVDLDVRAADQAAVDLVVQADADAVPAQRRVVRRRGLLDRERGVAALAVEGELGVQRVDARGLQPLVRPVRQLAARRPSSAPSRSANSAES